MRVYQYQCQREQDLVFYTENIWNRPIKMECTKFKQKKKGSKKPSYSYIGLKGYRIENDIKNSITRIHSCWWQNIHVIKQKHCV